MAEVSQPSDAVVTVCSTDDADSAVAFGQPNATWAAMLATSATSADLMAIASPAETAAVEVRATLVWLARLARPVNRLFHCDALIVPPADTVDIADCPRPYCRAPVPAVWLYPNGLVDFVTKLLYSSSKIVSPAEYAIKLFNPYHALC